MWQPIRLDDRKVNINNISLINTYLIKVLFTVQYFLMQGRHDIKYFIKNQ